MAGMPAEVTGILACMLGASELNGPLAGQARRCRGNRPDWSELKASLSPAVRSKTGKSDLAPTTAISSTSFQVTSVL